MPKRPKSNSVKNETTNDAPPSVRRSKRVKLEVKYEPEENDIKEEDEYLEFRKRGRKEILEDEYEPEQNNIEEEDEYLEDDCDEKENLSPKRGASRGSKYSNAKTVLSRGVKSVITDKALIQTFIQNTLNRVKAFSQ